MKKSWLRYKKRTESPDGSISEEKGMTFLGVFIEWLTFGVWIGGAALIWASMPIIYPILCIKDYFKEKNDNLKEK